MNVPVAFDDNGKPLGQYVDEPQEFYGIPNFGDAHGENRMFYDPNEDLTTNCEDTDYMKAIVAVRSARFEFGETGR